MYSTRLLVTVLSSLLCSAALSSRAAEIVASPKTPMTFEVVRDAASECQPKCPEWIYAAGTIERSTPARFRSFMSKLANKKLPVLLTSTGGDTDASLALGREFRRFKLETAIGHTAIVPCSKTDKHCRSLDYKIGRLTDARANCDSGCVYAFAGGAFRYNEPYNFVGVHRGNPVRYLSKSGNKSKKIAESKEANRIRAKSYREIRSYLIEMGIKQELADLALKHEKIYDVPLNEQKELGLVTIVGVKGLLAPRTCFSSTAAYCVTRK